AVGAETRIGRGLGSGQGRLTGLDLSEMIGRGGIAAESGKRIGALGGGRPGSDQDGDDREGGNRDGGDREGRTRSDGVREQSGGAGGIRDQGGLRKHVKPPCARRRGDVRRYT